MILVGHLAGHQARHDPVPAITSSGHGVRIAHLDDLLHEATQRPEPPGAKQQRSPIGWTPASRRRIVAERQVAAEDAQKVQELLADAASQLGHNSAAVRLAAVHLLARFADEGPAHRQACIDVLCAAVRAAPAPRPDEDDQEKSGEQPPAWHADRACKHAILSIITARLRADSAISWRGHNFDFSGLVFDSGEPPAEAADDVASFADAGLTAREVSFAGAQFTGGEVSFAGTQFTGGEVSFAGTQFTGAKVNFAGTQFTGAKVSFLGAWFAGGEVSFDGAEFSHGKVSFCSRFTGGAVGFLDAEFAGGAVGFLDAEFTGGEVGFVGAEFKGSEVSFVGAEFNGATVSFVGSKFTQGKISFVGAEFTSGQVRFIWTEFSGSEVRFSGAKFDGGRVDFTRAKFDAGEVDFTSVNFSRGLVDLSGAVTWSAPPSFDDWTASPASLQLPVRYQPA